MKPRVLVVEDEKNIVKVLKYNLEGEGYAVSVAMDGQTGLDLLKKDKPNLVLLDVMLPKLDGHEFLKRARQLGDTPILMLTARKEEVDRILGLELGADDYITKPFSVREVLARIKAVLRRTKGAPGAAGGVICAGGLEIDLERYETRVKGEPVDLTTSDYNLLKCLIEAEGKAMTRDAILETMRGAEKALELDPHSIDQQIARLRAKLGDEAARLVTVKNVGYRLKLR